ncbi:hypothetical protein ACFXKC_53715 [Streptomyces sp. NPDC059340]
MSSWRALSWHELTHGRAAGCIKDGGRRAGNLEVAINDIDYFDVLF